MTRAAKAAIVSVLIAVTVFAAAWAGASVGFFLGYGYGFGDTAGRAAAITEVLESLRAGKTEDAMARLENELDALIMLHHGAGRDDPPAISWMARSLNAGEAAAEHERMRAVARYRAERPSQSRNSVIRTTVPAHLQNFR
jgi:thymidine phosphorylase